MSPERSLIRELPVAPGVLRRLAARDPNRYPLLLESAAPGPLSRFSLLLAASGPALWLDVSGRLRSLGVSFRSTSFLGALDEWYAREQPPAETTVTLPAPFAGGWALYLGYELAQEIEPHLRLPVTPLPWQAFALRTPAAIVHEHESGRTYAVAESGHGELLERLSADAQDAARQAVALPQVRIAGVSEEDPQRFLERVRQAKEHVAAGDVYQANLSRPWEARVASGSAAALYKRLCDANPAPFAALAQWQDIAILSSSPERLVRIDARRIDTRPIAGTRPRSHRPGAEGGEMAALAAHPKERAEHVMLIDLERNDLGRVCEAGSVQVDELMSIETYRHVHHIVSNVSGRLRPGVSPVSALRAVFPGGTITGCPKFRCMQIIAALEGSGRGAYTGSLGYLGRDGRADLNILIRTMTLAAERLTFRAGAGIVADSSPTRELQETRAKARGLLAALGASDV
jgi:anthranilate synthase component 1